MNHFFLTLDFNYYFQNVTVLNIISYNAPVGRVNNCINNGKEEGYE